MAVHFLDAKAGQCRWPLWGPDKSIGNVCGAPAMSGGPYCPACRERAYAPSRMCVPGAPRDPNLAEPDASADETTRDLVDLVA